MLMKKRSIVCMIILILFSLTITACLPPGYTEEKKKAVTKEHADEATWWFKKNFSEAKAKRGEAYADSRDLFAAIEGQYEYKGNTYEYMYDYHNKNMYLGYEFETATEIASDAMKEYFGDNVRAIELTPPTFSFYTKCENDKGGDYGSDVEGNMILCDYLHVLPAGSDPTKYANIMLTEGFENSKFSYAEMYVDVLPKYNRNALEQFKGIRSQMFIKPVDFEFDGVYRVSYSLDKAEYDHLKLTEVKDGVYAGYYCIEEVSYDESGAEIPKDDVFDETSAYIKDNNDGSYTIKLPDTGGILLVFSKKKATVSRTFTLNDGSERKDVFDEWSKFDSPFGDEYDGFYYDINLPKSKYRLYYDIALSTDKENEYVITIE